MELRPNLDRHRVEKPIIENVLDALNDPIFARQAASAFFGMYNGEKHGYTGELITDDEVRKFAVFVKHVGKRVMSAHFQKFGGSDLAEKIIPPKKLQELSESDTFQLFGVLFHDLSHSVGWIAQNKNQTNKSPVQPHLTTTNNLNYTPSIEDELRGFIFGSLYYPYPSGNRSKLHILEANTYEEFEYNYLDHTLNAALRDSNNAYEEERHEDIGTSEGWDRFYNFKKEGERIKEEIMKNPPKDVIKNLKYIWEHRDEDRVLVNLFFKEIGPYIESLEKRKDYAVSK